jgi:hypothetical protein
MLKNIVKNIVQNKWVKLIMSLLIIVSTIPTILQDFENQNVNSFEHYGIMLIGVFYLLQALIDLLEIWLED